MRRDADHDGTDRESESGSDSDPTPGAAPDVGAGAGPARERRERRSVRDPPGRRHGGLGDPSVADLPGFESGGGPSNPAVARLPEEGAIGGGGIGGESTGGGAPGDRGTATGDDPATADRPGHGLDVQRPGPGLDVQRLSEDEVFPALAMFEREYPEADEERRAELRRQVRRLRRVAEAIAEREAYRERLERKREARRHDLGEFESGPGSGGVSEATLRAEMERRNVSPSSLPEDVAAELEKVRLTDGERRRLRDEEAGNVLEGLYESAKVILGAKVPALTVPIGAVSAAEEFADTSGADLLKRGVTGAERVVRDVVGDGDDAKTLEERAREIEAMLKRHGFDLERVLEVEITGEGNDPYTGP